MNEHREGCDDDVIRPLEEFGGAPGPSADASPPAVTETPPTSRGDSTPDLGSTERPGAVFVRTARRLGPLVGALAVVSVTLPGMLGTTLLVFTAANAGSPSNFHDPQGERYHRLLGTWETTFVAAEPEWPEGDDDTAIVYPEARAQAAIDAVAGGADDLGVAPPAVEPLTVTFTDASIPLRLAIEPVGDGPVNAVRPVPLVFEPPPGVDRDEWQPYGVVAVAPESRRLSLTPMPFYASALPTLDIELEPDAADPSQDRLRGAGRRVPGSTDTNTAPGVAPDAEAVSVTAERRVPPVQWLTLSVGVVVAAAIVTFAFALATGSAILPTYALSFAMGVFFGPVYGSVIAMLGVTGGALVGYAWAGVLARKRVSAVIDENPRAHVVRSAIVDKPLHLETFAVILLRFPPNSPFALTNLVMSSVGVRLLPYTLGTFVGIAPRTLLAVFLGVGVGSIADAQTAGGTVRLVIGLGVGLVVFVLAYRVMSKWARDALAEQSSVGAGAPTAAR